MTGCNGGAARRFVIIHGHFYQPPRENPWFDRIQRQPTAAPYHDWNECIYDQCYRPNAFSRLLDPKGMIVDIHNNYENLSFNFGPTLFSWLLGTHPKIAQRIVDADRESAARLSGHGNAIGQVYNHSIMPLSSRRDQLTQIRWAKAFFRKHFGRDTEGIWLAETAINMETVLCLIEEGIRFVILSPTQADCVRPMDGSRGWSPAAGGVDTRRPYRIFPASRSGERLPGHLDVFFFDEPLSREISFGDVLADAHRLGTRISSCFDERSRDDAALVLATDGETFGHHKPLSDMCLAYFFCKVAPDMNLIPVNFGWYLETHQPTWEVMLRDAFGEGTAWSCAHGVGRWTRDCGCKTGGPASWKQDWRAPLRVAFSTLQKRIDEAFEKALAPLFADPWTVRDRYPAIADARSFLEMKKLVEACGARSPLSGEQALAARRLIEAQKCMLFAFTSCGWFFSDVGGIETVQNIAYAARALQLGIEPGRIGPVRDEWLTLLDNARSNRPGITGKTLFASEVARYLRYDEIVAFAAVAEKIILLDEKPRLFAFDYDHFHVTLTRLDEFRNRDGYCAYGVDLKRLETFEHSEFAVLLHQNADAEITGIVAPGPCVRDRQFALNDPYAWEKLDGSMKLDLASIFEESSAHLTRHFLDQLSRDTRRRYAAWMDRNEKIITSLCSLRTSIPAYVLSPIAFIISDEWNTAINELEVYGHEEAVFSRLQSLWKKAGKYAITIDLAESVRLLEQLMSAEITIFAASLSFAACDRMRYLLNIVDRFNIPVGKNRIEDAFFSILKDTIRPLYNAFKSGASSEPHLRETMLHLIDFARRMNFNTDEFSLPDSKR